MPTEPSPSRADVMRWSAIAVFVVASILNYLDRQLLAAAAPALKDEFHLSNAQYGQVIAVFSMVYALSTPAAGLFVDRVGIRLGATLAVLVWSLAGGATALAGSLRSLLACRVALAIGESAAIPAATKASATYLRPSEIGLGTAVQSVGISIGSISAPLLFAAMAPTLGWRTVFLVSGALGFLWIPLWLFAARRVPARPEAVAAPKVPLGELLRDGRLWGVALANALVMTLYSLWGNWTTVYLVQERNLTLLEANARFAWIPPVAAGLGGFFGAWLAFRAIRAGKEPTKVRLRLCWTIAPVLLATAAIPFVESTVLAAAAMAVSLFACLAIVNNLQMIPIDVFGPGRAAFAGAMLTCSFALMQTVVSPLIGALVDDYGFAVVCLVMSLLPFIGVGVLTVAVKWPASHAVEGVVPA